MTTQEYVLKTLIVYVFVKALIFLPLAWMAFLVWWNERQERALSAETPATDVQAGQLAAIN